MQSCRYFARPPHGNHNPRVGGSSPSSGMARKPEVSFWEISSPACSIRSVPDGYRGCRGTVWTDALCGREEPVEGGGWHTPPKSVDARDGTRYASAWRAVSRCRLIELAGRPDFLRCTNQEVSVCRLLPAPPVPAPPGWSTPFSRSSLGDPRPVRERDSTADDHAGGAPERGIGACP